MINPKQNLLFILVFFFLLIGRLSISGVGYLDDTDEWLYYWIHENNGQFDKSDTWVKGIFAMQGQLPEMLIRIIQYKTVLPIAYHLHKFPLHPDILWFIGLYNITASLLLLFIVYKILRKLDFGFDWSLTGVLLLGTLYNFNIHTRHILPYDHALILQLSAFNLLLRKEISSKNVWGAGLLSAIGLTTYFGSFIFIFINAGLVALRLHSKYTVTVKKLIFFVIPFLLVFGGYELLTRINGRSYWAFVTKYSTTVNMASYDEGYDYIFRYFYSVEKIWGVILLIVFVGGVVLLFMQRGNALVKKVTTLGLVAYISYGSMVYFTHKLVFHGRILQPYYLFVLIGVLVALKAIKHKIKTLPIWPFILLALVNYSFVVQDLNNICYPREAIYRFQLVENPAPIKFHYYEEMATPIHYWQMTNWYIDTSNGIVLPIGEYNVGNLCFNFHYPDSAIHIYPAPKIQAGDSVIFEKLHFQSHPCYVFEYCARNGRNIFIEKQLKIRIVKTNRNAQ